MYRTSPEKRVPKQNGSSTDHKSRTQLLAAISAQTPTYPASSVSIVSLRDMLTVLIHMLKVWKAFRKLLTLRKRLTYLTWVFERSFFLAPSTIRSQTISSTSMSCLRETQTVQLQVLRLASLHSISSGCNLLSRLE